MRWHFSWLHAVALSATAIASSDAAARQSLEPSLKWTAPPEPMNLMEFVRNRPAAIRLGKALFHDVRLGSDGITACATCHHHAGVDSRTLDIVHPGADGAFAPDAVPGTRSFASLFPTTAFVDPADRFSEQIRSIDDAFGSPGILNQNFASIPAPGEEQTIQIVDPVFTHEGVQRRQVTGRNSPSVINAAFNVRQFWDGRANAWFNGVNGDGPVDQGAMVWRANAAGDLTQVLVEIDHASLASQAVGPVGSAVEMGAHGRGWVDVAQKLLRTRALEGQQVSPTDSVLGGQRDPLGGLRLTYEEMIEAAFRPVWWDGDDPAPGVSMMEANMALYFGLALQMYQSTLVSDDTRYDQWIEQDGPMGGARHLMSDQELRGMRLFFNLDPALPGTNCSACHLSPLFTVATYAGKIGGGIMPGVGVFPEGEPDSDLDGVPDVLDPFPLDATEWLDTDGDGIGNNADPDDDNDGIPDELDPLPLDVDPPPAPPADPRHAPAPLAFMPDIHATIAASRVFQEPPLGIEPHIEPLDFPLLGKGVEIVAADGTAVASLPLPRRRDLPCSHAAEMVVPAPAYGPGAVVEMIVSVVECRLTLTVALVKFPVGEWTLRIDGVDRGTLASLPDSIYDEGFYNIGVRPPGEDPGIGGAHANGTPLAASSRIAIDPVLVEYGEQEVPGTSVVRVENSFKTPGLRNVELTGPYFHNGGVASLEDVIRFYNRGGDHHEANIESLAPAMFAMEMSEQDIADMAAFLRTLTDERVRWKRAPFDHPELPLPDGRVLAAVGAAGITDPCATPLFGFEENLLVADPSFGDCDGNGVLDACQIAADQTGTLDADGDGILDACEPPCPADLDGDGAVGGGDLAAVLASWGTATAAADLDGSGVVDGGDLATVLAAWGACN